MPRPEKPLTSSHSPQLPIVRPSLIRQHSALPNPTCRPSSEAGMGTTDTLHRKARCSVPLTTLNTAQARRQPAAGVVVGIFLVSNPVGWGTALVLAAGSAAASYGTGVAAKKFYTLKGNELDIVSGLGVDSVC